MDYTNIIENLFDNFNMNIKLFNFKYKADDNITDLTLNNIQVIKNNEVFNIRIFNWKITLNMLTPVKKKTTTLNKENKDDIENLLNIKEITKIDINLSTGIINILIENPVATINMPIIQALDESYMFLISQINLDIILCKLFLEIPNTKVIFNNFIICSINII